ncbi:MAG: citrate/2-methylcitrate synthase, partial [Spirochaetales bacterium]|nr:citrate/2-methylcitrate synthase [Spirochaetales bacterium]
MSAIKQSHLKQLKPLAEQHNKIPAELYDRLNVLRGLRNPDGSGVLVGLTEIGDVHGYVFDEGERLPDEGRLKYRGYRVNDLVKGFQSEKRFGFEETAFLLLFGELPKQDMLKTFTNALEDNRELPKNFTEDMILKIPSPDIMNKLARSVLVSYSYDDNPDDISIENVLRQCIQLIAKLPTMAAYGYQAKSYAFYGNSLFIHQPKRGLSTSENFLHMMRPDSSYTPLEAELLDLCMVLHAEHGGGNNSSFTIHVVTSSDTDTYSAIASGICSLKGPKHGGANIKVVRMMEDIKANVKDWSNEKEVSDYLVKILQGRTFDKAGLVYGIGHAVYTKSDPRAVLLKEKAQELSREKGREEEFNLMSLIESMAPGLFQEVKQSDKVVSANVDFYSGFVYQMLDIPADLYTPIFAMARVAGWSAHRIEEIVSGGRIIRPAYRCIAPSR